MAPAEGQRGRPQRARSAANLSAESGLNSFGLTESGEEAGGGDEADMEEEVVGESPLCRRQMYHHPLSRSGRPTPAGLAN